ncbi:hypothetical protein EDF56_105173 [Novosphingobium sp. PhB165]|nr:hypothetical protein EDF56_105173 [Novosphingobium sp. PhB165]
MALNAFGHRVIGRGGARKVWDFVSKQCLLT